MKISEVIQRIKKYHYGYVNSKDGIVPISEGTTKDRILYGDSDADCTGIITTCWANRNVIKEAIRLGANLIICHEALFWNHGDHTGWLKEQKNLTYLNKSDLLDKHGIVVWRNHDYVHSGIPLENGTFADGIFYGLADTLGWTKYIDKTTSVEITQAEGWNDFSVDGNLTPLSYTIPETTVGELAEFLIDRLHLNGVRVIGNPDKKISHISIPFHVLGDARYAINLANEGKVDCFLTMEIVDFTLAEYVWDASLDNDSVAIIGMGHFNLEEPGMKYMATYIPKAIGAEILCAFVQAGDHYRYITRNQ